MCIRDRYQRRVRGKELQMGSCWSSTNADQAGVNVRTTRWNASLVHEGQCRNLNLTVDATLSEIKRFANETWGIAPNRLQLVWEGKDLGTDDATPLQSFGISSGGTIEARVTPAPVVVNRKATPEELLNQIQSEVPALKERILGCVEVCRGDQTPDQTKATLAECNLCNELLTQNILKMDGCFDGVEMDPSELKALKAKRKELLGAIQKIQDHDVVHVRRSCSKSNDSGEASAGHHGAAELRGAAAESPVHSPTTDSNAQSPAQSSAPTESQ
eukprot:TRINITY_DN26347_c0_g2_i1.p2 TRINITY_DN26347_c0_g2~~TRINITY_DN26347_c0_g2_i1.p2  ORF type:complete len:272 (-),score=59.02 TRINITY_DN26347_c0_g2_i1:152-967(-)